MELKYTGPLEVDIPALGITVKPGDHFEATGDDANVKLAQKALGLAGHVLVQDGEFGVNTETAVRRFQGANGLNPTGQIDPLTAALLDALLAKPVKAAAPLKPAPVAAFCPTACGMAPVATTCATARCLIITNCNCCSTRSVLVSAAKSPPI